jgi:hypothetical protein
MGSAPWLSAETALMAPYRRVLVASARMVDDRKVAMSLWSNEMQYYTCCYKQFNQQHGPADAHISMVNCCSHIHRPCTLVS